MDYFGWNERTTRKREEVDEPDDYHVVVPPEPMEVREDPLSETGVLRFLRRIAGRT